MGADRSDGRAARWAIRLLVAASVVGAAAARTPRVRAHSGTVHAGTPHWLLFGLLLAGVALVAGAFHVERTGRAAPERALAVLLVGLAVLVLGAVGLTELQVEPLATDATPIPRSYYPVVAVVAGTAIVLASVNLGIWRWRRRSLPALGVALGAWVLYPVLAGAAEYVHPAGYALVAAVPLLVGAALWPDVRPALAVTDRSARATGAAVAGLFVVFLLFSTGQVTLNPEEGTGVPDGAFLVVTEFANPLVLWPAVEFYLPSVPLFGALSVGTVVVFGLLAALVGVNATLGTAAWLSDAAVDRSPGVAGGLAATGATACCCCAPAAYGVVGAILGVSASPLYWAFLDPASPFGSLFFVATVALTTASARRLATALADAGVCDLDP